jgi:hypothetical protein
LTEARIGLLQELGFNWGKAKGQSSWDIKFVSVRTDNVSERTIAVSLLSLLFFLSVVRECAQIEIVAFKKKVRPSSSMPFALLPSLANLAIS